MAVQAFFLLLLVAKSMAIWDSNSEISWKSPGHARAVPSQCTETGIFCSTCQEAYLCPSVTASPIVIACESYELCGGTPGGAGCRNFTGGENAGECDCDNIGNVGILADPYDSTKYFFCIQPEGQYSFTCGDGEVFNSETNACEVETGSVDGEIIQKDSNVNCSANPTGFYTNDPTCETYTVCINSGRPGIFGRCSAGEAFDTSVSRCVAQCLLAPADFTCPEGGSGAFPDTSDCSVFHVCSNGVIFRPDGQCPTGQLFDPTSMTCVPSSTNVDCPVVNTCWAAYCDACGGVCPDTTSTGSDDTVITNTPNDPSPSSPSTASTTVTTIEDGGSGGTINCDNNPGYFQYSADCKQFWSCQDDDAGGYEAILYRCPGSLYFIPSMEYCSLQSHLPANPGCTIVP